MIKADVLVGLPQDLTIAIGLARLFEARNQSLRHSSAAVSTVNRTTTPSTKEEGNSRPPFMVCRMSLAELNERREKGLCYNCNEKFAPGHRCKKLFLIEACTAEEDGDMVMDVESNDEPETPGISLHAISGGNSPNTMKVLGRIQVVSTMVLLDSGSSHNFISEGLARKLGLQPTKNQSICVMVASGDKLTSKGICAGIAIKLGMFLTHADFYILPLESYDVVMGTHCLRTLGEILWDFSKLIMKFMCWKRGYA